MRNPHRIAIGAVSAATLLACLARVVMLTLDSSRPAIEKQALGLVSQAVRAYGGDLALALPQQATSRGIAHSNNGDWQFSLQIKGLQARFDITRFDYHRTECRGRGGSWRESDGIATMLRPGREAGIEFGRAGDLDLHVIRRLWAALHASFGGRPLIEKIALEPLPDGTVCDGIWIAWPNGTRSVVDIDRQTWMIAAVRDLPADGESQRHPVMLTRFLDRRLQRGVPISFHQDFYLGGKSAGSSDLLLFDVDSPIPDSVFLPPRTQSGSPTCRVPLDYHGLPVVRATVNGRPGLRFVIDTGAYRIALTSTAATALGVRAGPAVSTVFGDRHTIARGCMIDSIQLGTASARNVAADVLQSPAGSDLAAAGLAGVLGFSFLGRFQVTIDYPSACLGLAPRGTHPPPGTKLDCDIVDGVPIVSAIVGQSTVRIGLDSGANVVYLPPGMEDAVHHGVVLDDGARSFDGGDTRTYVTRVSSLTIAGYTFPGFPVYFSEPSAAPFDDTSASAGTFGV